MKSSDLYGGMQLGVQTSQEDTNPTPQTPAQKEQAQGQATGTPMKNTYGVIAMLVMIGILVGAKFALEKR